MHGTIEAGIHVELRPLGELAAFADDVRALIGRVVSPNVFYEPAFMGASAPVFGSSVLAGLVWRRTVPARLIGFFPVTIERRRYGFGPRVLAGWTHPYGPLGTPLIDRDWCEVTLAAWLDHVASDPVLPKLLLMPYLPAPDAARFDAALIRRGGRCAGFGEHARAMLQPGDGRDGYLDRAMPRKKKKDLRRLRHRLADRSAVMFETTTDPSGLAPALADFFTVETSGWKGRAGTAATHNPRIRGFVEAAVTALAHEGKASVTRMSVGGRAVAAEITLRSADAAWGWKIAYDEAFRRYSPGVQVLLAATERLLDDRSVVRTDSCATPDHPMIDHVWRERLSLSDRLMSVAPCSALTFRGVCALESLRRAAIEKAKRLRNRLRKTP